MKIAALFIHGKIVVGSNHGEAFSKLTNEEKQSQDLISGFFDQNSLEFTDENETKNYKTITMLRHAETIDHNLFDPGLSDNGKKDCNKIHPLKDPEMKVFTSPMLRCLETAEILQKIYNCDITVMSNLYEISYESHPDFIPNRKDKFPKFIWPEDDKIHIKKELPHEFFFRVKNIIENLPMKSLLITHHGIIQHILNIMTKSESYRQIPLASVITFSNGKTFS